LPNIFQHVRPFDMGGEDTGDGRYQLYLFILERHGFVRTGGAAIDQLHNADHLFLIVL